MFFNKRLKYLKEQYDIFNYIYFNNCLPKIKLKVGKDSIDDFRFGRFMAHLDFKNKTKIADYIIIKKNLLNDDYPYNEFRDVLVHEMVHYLEFLYSKFTDVDWKKMIYFRKKAIEFENKDEDKSWEYVKLVRNISNESDGHNELFKFVCHELNRKHKELFLRENGYQKRKL